MEFHHCIISTCTLYAIASLLRYFFLTPYNIYVRRCPLCTVPKILSFFRNGPGL